MRQFRSTAIAVLIIGALAAATAGVAAQSAPEQEIGVAAVSNADRVDGRHAVSASTKISRRAGKLVATDKRGYLPSNIVRPKWGLIKSKPASFRDGIIRWGEVAHKPNGFADGVDNQGVIGVTLTRVTGPASNISSEGPLAATASCPPGSKATGGGFTATNVANFDVGVSTFTSDLSGWYVDGYSNSGSTTLTASAVCMSLQPAGASINVARK